MSGFAGTLQRYIAEIVPEFLQGHNAGTFLEALGLTLDDGLQTLITGLRQSYPFKAFADNLDAIGEDRVIRRHRFESERSYRTRLAMWRQIHRHIASPKGVLLNLQPYFLPDGVPKIHVVYQCGDSTSATWHTIDEASVYSVYKKAPTNWDWDGQPQLWSRFWVIIDVSAMPHNGALWDDGTTWDDGVTVWDGYLNEIQRDDIVDLINESKAPYSILWGVIITDDHASFDPTATSTTDADGRTSLPVANWGTAIDAATGLPSRLKSAHFIFDLGQG